MHLAPLADTDPLFPQPPLLRAGQGRWECDYVAALDRLRWLPVIVIWLSLSVVLLASVPW